MGFIELIQLVVVIDFMRLIEFSQWIALLFSAAIQCISLVRAQKVFLPMLKPRYLDFLPLKSSLNLFDVVSWF